MINNIAIIAGIVITGLILWSPKLTNWTNWRAMTTPLASIIGSGFLVLGPILDASYGKYAPLVMLLLCLAAYLYGSAIRYNIKMLGEDDFTRSGQAKALEEISAWVLGFAYVISVAYYLNLFGAFAMSLTAADTPANARLVTTAVFLVIVFIGWTRGFKALEQLEYVSVTIKLAIIVGLLIGLSVFFAGKFSAGELVFNASEVTGWGAVTLAFGLIVTVQGFETSRYLGDTYDAETRRNSMRMAQLLSSAIYMTYIVLFAYVFKRGQLEMSETAIVDMLGIVAPILPVILVGAALSAQFSAAVADTGGSGGLINELTHNRVSPQTAYVVLAVIGILLTWSLNVFQIITYASRAFALYYGLQAGIAAVSAWRQNERANATGFALLMLLGFAITLFGQPVEGDSASG
jgi:hypothetical protein